MTPPCVYCADNRRDIRGLIFRARRDEWAGRPTTETCGRIAELRRAIAGLTQPWNGLVWCNPPYSNFAAWADRWAEHDRGVLLGYQLPQVRWTRGVFASADVVTFTGTEFLRPDRPPYRLRQPVFFAFRGVGMAPAERLAAADPYGGVLYGKPTLEATA